jgi:FixJ family two-component response regulator
MTGLLGPRRSPKGCVHIVDDDERTRIAIFRLLTADGYDVATYKDGTEFGLTFAGKELTGCILLDVRMPGANSFELQAAISESSNPLPVIFLTGFGDIAMCARAMKTGAIDFLTKPVGKEELFTAVQAALTKDALQRAERGRSRERQSLYESLTPRERQVFEMVTAGYPNKFIAAEVEIAERTVKAHRAHVMEKMRARSLADLVHMADHLRRDVPAAGIRDKAIDSAKG